MGVPAERELTKAGLTALMQGCGSVCTVLGEIVWTVLGEVEPLRPTGKIGP